MNENEINRYYKYIPYIYKDDYIIQKNNNEYCNLCKKYVNNTNHYNHHKHIKQLYNLDFIRDYCKQKLNQFISNRNNIKIKEIDIKIKEDSNNQHFICPISMNIMKEPVVAGDGHTYDKPYIQKWLENHSTSPLTNKVMDKILTPNLLVYKLINHELEKV